MALRVLAMNRGSSSLKFGLYSFEAGQPPCCNARAR